MTLSEKEKWIRGRQATSNKGETKPVKLDMTKVAAGEIVEGFDAAREKRRELEETKESSKEVGH